MLKFLQQKTLFYRFQQLVILLLHFALLYWILYTLSEAGTMPVSHVLYHFIGMSLAGALLIRGSAAWARYHYVKTVRKKRN